MRRDFAKKTSVRSSRGVIRSRWFLFMGFFAVLFCGAVFFLQPFKSSSVARLEGLSAHFARIKTWIEERKNRLHRDLVQAKQMATNKNNTESQIHFEFYTALPNMQVTVSEPPVKPIQAVSPPPTPEKISNHETEKKNPPEKITTTASVINADELEKEFARELKPLAYVIQLGIFKNKEGAERYSRSLFELGFSSRVMKLPINNKDLYRVQVGPFVSKEKAKLEQQRLEKRGITGTVLHKV